MGQNKQETFGRQLRRLREEMGLSMAELAERSGLHPSTISRLESDLHRRPHMDTFVLLARGLGLSVQELAILTHLIENGMAEELSTGEGELDRLLTRENLALLRVLEGVEPWVKYYLIQLLTCLKQQYVSEAETSHADNDVTRVTTIKKALTSANLGRAEERRNENLGFDAKTTNPVCKFS